MSAILGATNADYHSNRSHLSSSGLKLILKDPYQFYLEYVLGQRVETEKDAFTEGTLVHALILEPHKIAQDYAIFSGLRKQGKLWEYFKQDNATKICISAPQMLRAEKLVKACQALPVAMELLKGTLSEHNMVAEFHEVPVKARADAINIEQGYMIDIKTTSMPSDLDFFRNTIKDYSYQLSASLYKAIAECSYSKPFSFYWIVLSKADEQCHVYKAKASTLADGDALTSQALLTYKHCVKTGQWQPIREKVLQAVQNYEILEV